MFPIFKSVDRQRWLYFWHALLSLMYFVLCCPLALSDVDYYVLGFFGSITEWVPSISDTANLAANPTGARFVLSICWVWGLIMFIPVLYVFFVEPGEFELSHFSGLSWPYSVGSVFFLFFFHCFWRQRLQV